MNVLKKHLKSNSGDGYISFVIILFVLLIVFGLLVTIMSTAVNTRNIRRNIDEAAQDVFDEIKRGAYDKITNGAVDYSFTSYSDDELALMFYKHLGATIEESDDFGSNPAYVHKNARNRVDYKIEDLHFDYLPQVVKYNETGIGDAVSINYKVGDVNNDGNVDDSDYTAFRDALNINTFGALVRCDINGDGNINSRDLLILEKLVEYHKSLPGDTTLDNSANRSAAMIVVTFKLTIPLRFGTFDFGADADEYSYSLVLSFKPA